MREYIGRKRLYLTDKGHESLDGLQEGNLESEGVLRTGVLSWIFLNKPSWIPGLSHTLNDDMLDMVINELIEEGLVERR